MTVLLLQCGPGKAGAGPTGPQTIFLTGGTSWTVPSNWNNAINKIECIGGGAGGGAGSVGGSSGNAGGGGAYATVSNITLTPGANIPIQIGQGGIGRTASGSTWTRCASWPSSTARS